MSSSIEKVKAKKTGKPMARGLDAFNLLSKSISMWLYSFCVTPFSSKKKDNFSMRSFSSRSNATFLRNFTDNIEISAVNTSKKLTSRKFWTAVTGAVMALLVAFKVDKVTSEQVLAVITSSSTLIAYIIGEGLVDAAKIKGGK
ncbi:hypothetical protein ACR6HW_08345 [Fusibacter sp. JL298sf-3]